MSGKRKPYRFIIQNEHQHVDAFQVEVSIWNSNDGTWITGNGPYSILEIEGNTYQSTTSQSQPLVVIAQANLPAIGGGGTPSKKERGENGQYGGQIAFFIRGFDSERDETVQSWITFEADEEGWKVGESDDLDSSRLKLRLPDKGDKTNQVIEIQYQKRFSLF